MNGSVKDNDGDAYDGRERSEPKPQCRAAASHNRHPEEHRDLIVRVAGYSAFFNVLSKATQDDIIARTEHAL